VTKNEFVAELSRLQREHESSDGNVNCIGSHGCSQSVNCMFCNDCERCYKSTHSNRCKDSSFLTHCHDCQSCYSSAYCESSAHCINSNYLVNCTSCTECTYCFGCVGLERKDFHILNKPYGRQEYFKMVLGLRRELGLAAHKG